MKELDRQILFSADFREHLATSENFIDLGERRLKGKQQLVRVYGLA
jgi:class 3 adenylate cyclase